MDGRDIDALVERIDRVNARIGEQRELLRLIAQADAARVWERNGAHDGAHWVSMWLGVSDWKASRWLASGHALEALPRIARALESGELSLGQGGRAHPVRNARGPGTTGGVGSDRSSGAIRRRGDVLRRSSMTEAAEIVANRSLRWWWSDDGRQLGMEAWLPAADGAVVVRAIDRLASRVPAMPGEDHPSDIEVVHASTARRLACTARIQALVEDASGTPIRLGRMRREPSAWMLRQLKHRDGECAFPGCGHRRFTQGHHVVWWDRGGRTDLDNFVLVCSFHHRLVREQGWTIERDPSDGAVRWFRPDGTRYRAGPAPPVETVA